MSPGVDQPIPIDLLIDSASVRTYRKYDSLELMIDSAFCFPLAPGEKRDFAGERHDRHVRQTTDGAQGTQLFARIFFFTTSRAPHIFLFLMVGKKQA